MTAFGEPALWLALILAAWAGIASIAAILLGRSDLARSGARGVPAALASIAVAVGALMQALWARDFSFRYVASNTALNLPDRYVGAALWSGAGGSLLVIALAVAACAAVALRMSRRQPALVPWVTGILAGVLLVLLASVAFDVNPFAMLAAPVGEGRGLRAELQDPAFLVHPPLIALGVAASAVPFAFTVGALATRTVDPVWAHRVRAWTSVSWASLSLGILAGARWAYTTDGWGAWARDPVQGSWLLPWLAGALLLHGNVGRKPTVEGTTLQALLALASFVLGGLALALTRSGIVDSPHFFAFSRSGATLAMIPMAAIVGCAMLVTRGKGGMIPAVSAPASGRVGTHVFRAGLALLVIGLFANGLRRTFPLSLGDGEIWHGKDPLGRQWSVASQGRSTYQRENFAATAVSVLPTVDGRRIEFLNAELRAYLDSDEHMLADRVPAPSLLPGLWEDVKLVLVDERGQRPRLRLTFTPLGSWPWAGGMLMVLGTLLALITPPRRDP